MYKYDIAVLGGGFAGAAAAISAARAGRNVVLIEKSNCMGGAASWGLVYPFMGNVTKINDEYVPLSQGIFKEITDELKRMLYEIDGIEIKGKIVHRFNEEYLKIIFNRIAVEAGVNLLFHTYLTDVNMYDGVIKSVKVSSRSGSFEIEAKYFIDATGDANLTFLCGYPFRLGRGDGLCQPMTLNFRIANVEQSVRDNLPKKQIDELYRKFQAEGKIKNPREDVLMFINYIDGVVHFNSTRIIKRNPTDPFDLTQAEIDAREQVMELYLFLKNNIKGFENCQLLMSGMEIGVRESRMIDGEYLLSCEDLKNCTKFEDSIALGNYDIDIHNPEGSGTSHYYFKSGEYYSIPYRSLIPKKSKNLIVAGRCISVDHYAQASIRIMPIVCAIGEAAGTAAALAYKTNSEVLDIDVKLLLRTLAENGVVTEIV